MKQKAPPQKIKLWDWSLSSASGWNRNLPLYQARVGGAWLGVSRTGCHPDVSELLAGLNPGSLMALLTAPFSCVSRFLTSPPWALPTDDYASVAPAAHRAPVLVTDLYYPATHRVKVHLCPRRNTRHSFLASECCWEGWTPGVIPCGLRLGNQAVMGIGYQ